MIRYHLKDILSGTGGSLITSAVGPELFTGISIDSRTVKAGEVFFALRGDVHDGHDHLREAWDRGAALAVIDDQGIEGELKLAPIPVVVVPDTTKALQSMAAWWRSRHDLPVIGVVGSVGKTTTKEMAASILSTAGPCLKNPGNYNNHIGLPLSILQLTDYHRYGIFEIGANIPGEIGYLSSLLAPSAAVITRIGWAHLEGFGSLEKLVAEKGSILDKLPASGWCAINADDTNQADFKNIAVCEVIRYGVGSGDVSAEGIVLAGEETSFTITLPTGKGRVHLKAFGEHYVENALAAAAVTLPLDIPVEQLVAGLGSWRPADGRGEIISPVPDVHFIDDTYNANPLSVRAALKSLAHLSQEGVTVAVLGEMKELGEHFESGHRQVGVDAARFGIDYLIAVGHGSRLTADGAREEGMGPDRVIECPGNDEAVKALGSLLTRGVWVLFKGSRAAQIEQIIKPFMSDRAMAGSGGI